MSDELTPITREEHFLAKAGGQDVTTPTPITRRETFLQGIIDASGGGGGGGGGVLVVHSTNGTLDKTWKEIHDAMGTSLAILLADSEYNGFTVSVGCEADWEGGDYWIGFGDFHANVTIFLTDSEDGYPQAQI